MKKTYIFYGFMAVFGVVFGVFLQKLTAPVVYDHPTIQEAFCSKNPKCDV